MKVLTRIFLVLLGTLTLMLFIYHFGPKPGRPVIDITMPPEPADLTKLEDSLNRHEASLPVKPGDAAEILWAGKGTHTRTHLALIYLHGFTASHEEGMPLHKEFATRYGMNLLLSRLSGHGLSVAEPLLDLTADSLYNSAKAALATGSRLGDSVILMATSAGAALALELAAKEKGVPIKALLLYSPCIRIFDPNAWVLGGPWGLQLAHQITGSKYLYSTRKDSATARYWYVKYRIEGAVALEQLLENEMIQARFRQVTVPVLTCMYYKDKVHQDSTVKTESIRWMNARLGTPAALKKLEVLPDAGDHVIACYLRSKDLPAVRTATFSYAENVLGLKPVVGLLK